VYFSLFNFSFDLNVNDWKNKNNIKILISEEYFFLKIQQQQQQDFFSYSCA
jgi:hypothetical protein